MSSKRVNIIVINVARISVRWLSEYCHTETKQFPSTNFNYSIILLSIAKSIAKKC